jgi:hypothetical protein
MSKILHVVFQPEPGQHEVDHLLAVFRRQAVGPADAGVVGAVLGQRHRNAAFSEIDFDQSRPLRAVGGLGQRIADIKR